MQMFFQSGNLLRLNGLGNDEYAEGISAHHIHQTIHSLKFLIVFNTSGYPFNPGNKFLGSYFFQHIVFFRCIKSSDFTTTKVSLKTRFQDTVSYLRDIQFADLRHSSRVRSFQAIIKLYTVAVSDQKINKVIAGDSDCAEHIFQCFLAWCTVFVIISDLFDLIKNDITV